MSFRIVSFAAIALASAAPAAAQKIAADIPTRFEPVRSEFDYTKREVEIPMRDGVKLHTVIFVPRGLPGPAPFLLTRTPYDAGSRATRANSPKLGAIVPSADDVVALSGYIRVYQDVRGKYGSEGQYIVNRPWRGPLNPTKVDQSTDTYDTIAWLLKNVTGNNGRVGTIGTSYDGWTTLMSLIDPHPALKAAVPINPMVDGWMGDDWFHGGAFRQTMASWIYDQTGTRKNEEKWWSGTRDDYDRFLRWGSAGAMGRAMGMEQLGFWNKLTQHPNYDSWWQQQAVDKKLGGQPLGGAAVLMVHGLFDQEDIHGPMSAYEALEAKDTNNDRVFLAIGPWAHGGSNRDGSSLGAIKFANDTGAQFRREVLQPFLDQHLKGGPDAKLAPVLAYETGADVWRRSDRWAGTSRKRPLYLQPNGALRFSSAASGSPARFVADPAKPVPYIPRPVMGDDSDYWRPWLVSDQRHASSRPDVLVFMTEPLTEPLRIAGTPFADINASTTGEDADWVVKLIDVYPDEVPEQPELGGYQMMVSGDILRGRFREDPAKPVRAVPGREHRYRFALPAAHHTFRPGHRVMVQVQSSWFPLYDRNPQTWVDNIFFAQPGAYKAQTHSLAIAGAGASFIELPVVDATGAVVAARVGSR